MIYCWPMCYLTLRRRRYEFGEQLLGTTRTPRRHLRAQQQPHELASNVTTCTFINKVSKAERLRESSLFLKIIISTSCAFLYIVARTRKHVCSYDANQSTATYSSLRANARARKENQSDRHRHRKTKCFVVCAILKIV